MGYEDIKNRGFDHRSPEERHAIAVMGGKASGEVRRRNAEFRKTLNALLTAPIDHPEWTPILKQMGVENTLESAVNMSMLKEALNGNVKAYLAVAKYAGQSEMTRLAEELMKADVEQKKAATEKLRKVTEMSSSPVILMNAPASITIPSIWDAFTDNAHTHKIITSGRAGTKSSAAAIGVVYKIVTETNCAAVVIRKRHNKLRKTVYKEILRAIGRLNLSRDLFDIKLSPMQVTYLPNGNTIYFTGSDAIDDTKGVIDESRPIRVVVLDELTEFFDVGEGGDELENILATFVRGNDDDFQMIYLYNPPKNPNAAIVKWCRGMEERPDVIHVHVDYRDVPVSWLGQKLIDAAEILKAADECMYRWVWLGESIGIDEAIYYMFGDRHRRKPALDAYEEIHIGVDYGQQNATTAQPFGWNDLDHRLEGITEYYHSGRESGKQKSPSEYAAEIIEMMEQLYEDYSCSAFYVYLDPSAQGLKEELKRASADVNYQVIIRNAKNDVALGISRVQKLFAFGLLTVSPTQKNLIREIETYEYDKKSIERGREVPVKIDDHGPDAMRYAVMGAWTRVRHYLPTDEKEAEFVNPVDAESEEDDGWIS